MLRGEAPSDIQITMRAPGRLFQEYLEYRLGKQRELAQIARIIMCYLHGELSIYVSGRSSEDAATATSTISAGAHHLLKLLSAPSGEYL